jgi:hypothetical protein
MLSVIHPDLLDNSTNTNDSYNKIPSIPQLKRSNNINNNNNNNNDNDNNINNIFYSSESPQKLLCQSPKEFNLLSSICINSLNSDDYKFIINICNLFKQGIVDPNIKIILSGNKSTEIYKFIYYHLSSDEKIFNTSPHIMIIHPSYEPELYYSNAYRIIRCN